MFELYQQGKEEFKRYVGRAVEHFLKKQIRELKGRESGESLGKENEASFLYGKVKKAIKDMHDKQQVFLSLREVISQTLVGSPNTEETEIAGWDTIVDCCAHIRVVERQYYHNADKKRDPVIRDAALQELIRELLEAVGRRMPFIRLFNIVMKKVSWDAGRVIFLEDLFYDSEDGNTSEVDTASHYLYQEADPRVASYFKDESLEHRQIQEAVKEDLRSWPENDQILLILFYCYGIKPNQLAKLTDRFGKQTVLYEEQNRISALFCETYQTHASDQTDLFEEARRALNGLMDWLLEEGLSLEARKWIEATVSEK